jgi:hypothetical protein
MEAGAKRGKIPAAPSAKIMLASTPKAAELGAANLQRRAMVGAQPSSHSTHPRLESRSATRMTELSN